MRALADVLCQFADGCNFASDDGGDAPPRIGGIEISGSAATAQAHPPVKKERGTYYKPPTAIKDVPGVRKTSDHLCDFYSGTIEALAATGIASTDMFPRAARPRCGRRFVPADWSAPR